MSENDQTNNATPAPQAASTTPPPPPQPTQAPPVYTVPPQQNTQVPPPPMQQQQRRRAAGFGSAKKEKWPAVILAFLLGFLGIHKFYLGYKNEGLAMLLISLIGGLCFGIGTIVILVISYIEAAKYISLTEEDFDAVYVRGYKGWF